MVVGTRVGRCVCLDGVPEHSPPLSVWLEENARVVPVLERVFARGGRV